MIPKKIHYCWFGKNPIPQEYKNYIESWKKYCPDYQIIEWNEDNYDISKNKYMKDAYSEKKWGFVPDFARLDIIYNEGGFYLDTDVELLRSLDELRENVAYMGIEGDQITVSPGLGFGAEPQNGVIKDLRDLYNDLSFYNEDGTLNTRPSPYYATEFFIKKGFEKENKNQIINGFKIYSSEYFAPKDYYSGDVSITEKSISIHQYSMSWVDPKVVQFHKFRQEVQRHTGKKFAYFCERIYSAPYRIYKKFKEKGFYGTIKFVFHKFKKQR